MTKQVPVVARHLDDERVGAKPAIEHQVGDVPPAVDVQGLGVRREVGVVAEDVLRGDVGRQLDEQARRTDPHVQRVERLALVQLVGREIALARRRHAEVDERAVELGRTQTTTRIAHDSPWVHRRQSVAPSHPDP